MRKQFNIIYVKNFPSIIHFTSEKENKRRDNLLAEGESHENKFDSVRRMILFLRGINNNMRRRSNHFVNILKNGKLISTLQSLLFLVIL